MENIEIITKTLQENGVSYRWYTEDRLIEMDLGGQDRLFDVMEIITKNLEYWCYELELDLEIKIEFAFERVMINY